MRKYACIPILIATLMFPAIVAAHASNSPQVKKDYLSDSEADKIREAGSPSERIKLYVSFAEDRLTKFQYELARPIPDRRRSEILNSLLNAYSGCFDDAADQIAVAQEKQADIRIALKLLISKGKDFLQVLQKLEKDGPELDAYKETLDDALEGTQDAIEDGEKALKEMAPPPIRRKQP
jgi:tagatose-1,6-bisphosphate aldolase